jgi:DNA-binding transcriptional regulator YhcF (GntR family)
MQFNIQKSGSTPLHMQLLDELRHWIMTGLVNPHERLPGEWELALELEISRATIQKAWQNAEEEGLIYRVPGKGTFIGEPRPKNATTQSIALIVPDFRGTFAVHMLSGSEQRVHTTRREPYPAAIPSGWCVWGNLVGSECPERKSHWRYYRSIDADCADRPSPTRYISAFGRQ